MLRRLLPTLFVIVWVFWPGAARSATCGFVGPSGVPPVGTLDPLVEGSTYELEFREGDEPKNLLIIFEVSGCELGPEYARRVAVLYEFATVPTDDAFGPKTVTATRTRATWKIPVNPDLMNAGVHRGTVVIGGNETTVKRVTVPVILAKSESEWVAIFVGGIAWVIGVLSAFVTSSTARSVSRLLLGVVLTAAPVYTILKAQYWDVPGWSGTEAKIYLFIGVLAASFGAAKAAMLDQSQNTQRKQKTPAPSPASANVAGQDPDANDN